MNIQVTTKVASVGKRDISFKGYIHVQIQIPLKVNSLCLVEN